MTTKCCASLKKKWTPTRRDRAVREDEIGPLRENSDGTVILFRRVIYNKDAGRTRKHRDVTLILLQKAICNEDVERTRAMRRELQEENCERAETRAATKRRRCSDDAMRLLKFPKCK